MGAFPERLDPDAGRCEGDGGRAPLCATHKHPLLYFAVCSICVERDEVVEGNLADQELHGGGGVLPDEANTCSWYGLHDRRCRERYQPSLGHDLHRPA